MYNFFSFVSINEKMYYFNWLQRQQIYKDELKLKSGQIIVYADSHREIAEYYKINPDKCNHYIYNFFTQQLTKKKINFKEDFNSILIQCQKINIKDIFESLIIKKIINPVAIRTPKITLNEAEKILKEWIKISDTVWKTTRYTVWDALGDVVWDAVEDAVWDAVGDLLKDALGGAVAFGDAVGTYMTSFFKIKYNYDFSPCVRLWEAGYIPSFDGKIWRLHGYKGKILYEYKLRSEA